MTYLQFAGASVFASLLLLSAPLVASEPDNDVQIVAAEPSPTLLAEARQAVGALAAVDGCLTGTFPFLAVPTTGQVLFASSVFGSGEMVLFFAFCQRTGSYPYDAMLYAFAATTSNSILATLTAVDISQGGSRSSPTFQLNPYGSGTHAGRVTRFGSYYDPSQPISIINRTRGTTILSFPAATLPPLNASGDHDGDGIPDSVERILNTSVYFRDNDVFGQPRLFVMQAYRDFFSREGDAAGVGAWTEAIASGANNYTDVVDAFLRSEEFQGVPASIVRLYAAFFGRVPDAAGLRYNIQFANRNGLTVSANEFARSAEFERTYGTVSNENFVRLLYQNVLGRAPDAEGLAYNASRLSSGVSRGELMLSFSESSEFRARKQFDTLVIVTYLALLQREPDAGGLKFWSNEARSGRSLKELIGSFLASEEYKRRFAFN